ncbi:group II intron reverse transcriptase/maturase [Streptomyces sp. NBC_00825]|uniref:group II intron reverse transcriptase/maturase n=1 Tax=unclassified Streptomyces TaxID=2593676 RepID=UPI0022553848|nr:MULTISPECIES: group II intron reverse transcriptase/maturase [unclassified Streptomyces]WTB51762.1 group II intron reverse transcriptase/maturase [Streptomyces sp. NBC_00826]WTH95059.1 group II intron reverse transcriptase/maturase [Streptomyces sp. NBC_00825]WTI03793.1 group II intron reverse transcriptase/maturase [Streptomyces sp. NBC_00822]MCX4869374.1 group II intron reverse transcriptase/maturase [Streptomyces sp. NBC_00906]MCX4900613.1 group II intron reverse transcriptase/maturase [
MEAAAAMLMPAMNGPEGDLLDWHSIDWATCEENVRRLRQRIFKATQDGDLKKVRNLQKLMLRSHSNTLVSVKRVTQLSSGRKTAGIDGERALTPKARGKLATEIHRSSQPWKARPVKRVFIPKSNGKQRPLGIPVIRDRVLQARVKNALEPEWEARFEPRSYGFRPGRSCQDAISAIFWTVCGKAAKRRWVLDADLSAAFDRIDHCHLMASIGQFPARNLIRGWLKAGVIDCGRFAPTEEGTPQGGVISPLLMNVALHGLERAAGCRYAVAQAGREPGAAPGTPVLVRYADDFAVLCHDEMEVHQVRARLEEWLKPRGLRFNEEKTKVVRLVEGFDFLGFTVRRTRQNKLIITPSTAACKRLRTRLRTEAKALQGANAAAVLRKLIPVVRGWAAYYRSVASSTTFSSLDYFMWRLVFKWARRRHRTKPVYWIVNRYFGQFHPSRRDRWVFGDRNSGAFLPKFAWTSIVRHQLVKGGASPDDPALTEYWRNRRRKKAPPPMDKMSLVLAVRQQGLCPLCKQALIVGAEYEPDSPREWINWFAASKKMLHKHHFVYRRDGGTDERNNLRLVHSECHRQHHAGDGKRATELC